jgi:ADP-ribose pyrophosphatase YjhB (NUDIX family)
MDDDRFPGYWGFPAATKKTEDEPWEATVARAAKEKLGVEVEILKLLGEETKDRGEYELTLRDYEVKIIEGQPTVPQDVLGMTQYTELKWTDDTSEIEKSAAEGSACSNIFLTSQKHE